MSEDVKMSNNDVDESTDQKLASGFSSKKSVAISNIDISTGESKNTNNITFDKSNNLTGYQDHKQTKDTKKDSSEEEEIDVDGTDANEEKVSVKSTTQENSLKSKQDGRNFVDYNDRHFDTDSDFDHSGSESEKDIRVNMGNSGSAKKQKCQGTSSEDDDERPWRSNRMKKKLFGSKKQEPQMPSRLQRGGLAHLKRQRSDHDTQQYRSGYPGKKDHASEKMNRLFYEGKISSKPDGMTIDEFHENWWEDYDRLEAHHGFIQWLFPIRESGLNIHAQELQLHEAEAIKKSPAASKRFLKSYEMMLNFYGLELVDRATGDVKRAANYKQRFDHLNHSMHNYLRITRILKCLGEMGLERYKAPFLRLMLHEAINTGLLNRTLESCYNYWIGTVKDDVKRENLRDLADKWSRGEYTKDDENAEEERDERSLPGAKGEERRREKEVTTKKEHRRGIKQYFS